MAIPFVNKSELTFATRSSMEGSKPPESVIGDWLGVFPYIEKAKALACEGGTEFPVGQLTWNVSKRAAGFWLVHDGTAAKIKVTWEGAEATGSTLLILAYREVKATPINVVSAWEEKVSATSSVCPSVTTTTKACRVVAISSNVGGLAVSETPAGMTLRSQLSPDAADVEQAEAGASGTKTYKFATPSVTAVMTFALAPPEEVIASLPATRPLSLRNRIRQP